MDTQATIDMQQSVPIILTAVSEATGEPIPGAVISNVQWMQDNPIGQITPTSVPNQYLFTPFKPGTVNISATAVITLN